MKKRILLIYSEPMKRERLRKKLEKQNYEVRCAAHGQDALEKLDFQQTDLLLIDLDVPAAESLGLLSRIAARNPALRVVGMTERTDLPEVAPSAKVSALVEKPVAVEGLFCVLENLLQQAPSERDRVRLVHREAGRRPAELQSRFAGPEFYPAPYRGWGINE